MARRRRTRRGQTFLPPHVFNAGIQQSYAREIRRIIRPMMKTTIPYVLKNYKKFLKGDQLAYDITIEGQEVNLDELLAVLRRKFHQYIMDFNRERAERAAVRFINKIDKTNRAALMAELKRVGVAIKFTVTPAYERILEEAAERNVNLIRTIAPSFFDKIIKSVYESAKRGRDMASLYQTLLDIEGVTERKAQLIAMDQTNKATQELELAQSRELGIKTGTWVHIPGEKTSRKSHEEMDGKEFDLDEGLFDYEVGKNVKPGELPYCRCTYRPNISELLET